MKIIVIRNKVSGQIHFLTVPRYYETERILKAINKELFWNVKDEYEMHKEIVI